MKDSTQGFIIIGLIIAGTAAFVVNPFMTIVIGIVATPFIMLGCGIAAVVSKAKES